MSYFALRFTGTDPEPRPGLSSGHMPHSINLPSSLFLKNHISRMGYPYTTILDSEGLKNVLVDAVGRDNTIQLLSGNLSVITTCGSGMTAGILWLGLQLLNIEKVSLYDEVISLFLAHCS